MKRYIQNVTHAARVSPFELDTHVSYYNNFLDEEDLKYMQRSKNRTGKIVDMSPSEYYHECATRIFDTTVEALQQQRRASEGLVEQYMQDMLNGDKFPLCYLNYPDNAQEGLHGMMAAGEAFGWDTKFPVLVVEAVDDRVEQLNKIWRYYNDAVYDAQECKYAESNWEEEFVKEVEWNLENATNKHYNVVIVSRRDKQECASTGMDYAIEIALEDFQDIMHPTTVFEPEFKDEADDDAHYNFDIDGDDLDLDIEDWLATL